MSLRFETLTVEVSATMTAVVTSTINNVNWIVLLPK